MHSDPWTVARLAELDEVYGRILDRATEGFVPSSARIETARRNAQAKKRARKGLPPLMTVRQEARRHAERQLFALAARPGETRPELRKFLELARERDQLREAYAAWAEQIFDRKAVDQMARATNGKHPRPVLVGLTEIAERLGVSRQRVDQLRRRPDFPEPVAKLSAGLIWESRDVEAWIAEHRPEQGSSN